MSLSLSHALTLSDSVASALRDIKSTLVTTPYSGITTILTGLSNGTPSLLNDIVNFLDAPSELVLLPVASTSVNTLTSQLVTNTTLASYYPPFYPVLNALETLTSGYTAFLVTNNAQVALPFATLWNTFAGVAVSLNFRPAGYVMTTLAPAQVFPESSTDLGSIVMAGASSLGQTLDGTQVAPQMLYYRISGTGAGNMTTPSTIQVSYIPSQDTTPLTVSFTPSSGLTVGTKVNLGVSGLAVTALTRTVAGSDTGYTYTISAEPPRTISY